ncbi:MAG: nicotinate-nucleotide--dimethylbenzimidazole phosphoribosyltransferase [Desulfobacteraceae bacterium]|nr:nicotinate-nucleotide--dimethylbenzimidazole phosphoribosyltransferase [Desulfobacteraceae bacterium]
MSQLEELLGRIEPADPEWEAKAWARLHDQIRPRDALGELERGAARLAAMKRSLSLDLSRKIIFVMAGDHGVAADGVSAYPQEVTAQMVFSFTRGWASINVLARHAGAAVRVVDCGIVSEIPREWDVIRRKIGCGTASIARGPAMSRREAEEGLLLGAGLAEDAVRKEGFQLIGTGDMGIGNTTPSAAIACAFGGHSPAGLTGRGTGIDDAGHARKVAVIETALKVNRPDPKDPVDVLAKVGGYEIAALAGAVLGAAAAKTPVICDGLIATAGALVACRLSPASAGYLFLSHESTEPGHLAMCEMIGLRPLLNLHMRLGEGTGTALAMNIVDASAKLLVECKTFAEAGVTDTGH